MKSKSKGTEGETIDLAKAYAALVEELKKIKLSDYPVGSKQFVTMKKKLAEYEKAAEKKNKQDIKAKKGLMKEKLKTLIKSLSPGAEGTKTGCCAGCGIEVARKIGYNEWSELMAFARLRSYDLWYCESCLTVLIKLAKGFPEAIEKAEAEEIAKQQLEASLLEKYGPPIVDAADGGTTKSAKGVQKTAKKPKETLPIAKSKTIQKFINSNSSGPKDPTIT